MGFFGFLCFFWNFACFFVYQTFRERLPPGTNTCRPSHRGIWLGGPPTPGYCAFCPRDSGALIPLFESLQQLLSAVLGLLSRVLPSIPVQLYILILWISGV